MALRKTEDWCFHEGSYGHNPEYGMEHELSLRGVAFWRFATSGEGLVPKTVSKTGFIGRTHTAAIKGGNLVVEVTEGETGEKKLHKLDLRQLWKDFIAAGGKRAVRATLRDPDPEEEFADVGPL